MPAPPKALPLAQQLAEAQAEIARLKAELDRYQGREVYYTTSDHLIESLAALPTDDLPPGTVVRCTDNGAEFELVPGRLQGPWAPRP